MGAQYCELDVQGRVEHRICRFLEGEYPLVFSLTHILPLSDGLLSRIGTFVVVAYDTAQ